MFKTTLIASAVFVSTQAFCDQTVMVRKNHWDANQLQTISKSLSKNKITVNEVDYDYSNQVSEEVTKLRSWNALEAERFRNSKKILCSSCQTKTPETYNRPEDVRAYNEYVLGLAPDYFIKITPFKSEARKSRGRKIYNEGANVAIYKKIESSCVSENEIKKSYGEYYEGVGGYSCEYEKVLSFKDTVTTSSYKPKKECKIVNGNNEYFDIGVFGYYRQCVEIKQDLKVESVQKPDSDRINEELDQILSRN